MKSKFKAPKTRRSHVWQIKSGKETGRWKWEVQVIREDGTEFRRGGTRKTEPEGIKARDEAFREFNQSGGKPGPDYTIKTWCEYCLDGGMTGQSVKTRYHYRGWIETRVYPAIGSIKLRKLTVPVLQAFYQGLQDSDTKSAAVRTRTALNACLTRALEVGLIDRHVGRLARLKREEARGNPTGEVDHRPGKRFLSLAEQAALIEQAQDTPMYMPVLLGLYFGIRIGECLGLRWGDVDFEAKVIHVRWQAQRIPGEGKRLTNLKSKNSYRSIPIPARLLPIFVASKGEAGPDDFVAPTKAGTTFTPQEFSSPFKRLCKDAKINDQPGKPDCTHHDLRSTFLSKLANEVGILPAELKEIAGHGKIDTTFRYYIQASKEGIRAAMEHV